MKLSVFLLWHILSRQKWMYATLANACQTINFLNVEILPANTIPELVVTENDMSFCVTLKLP